MTDSTGPRLDDRSFADLMREAEAVMRRKAPSWTDHSPGDPGITLVETFAYLTEVLLYRLNRVPDKVHAALLNLLGVTQRPPAAATVRLTFSRDDESVGQPIAIPAGTAVSDPTGTVTFETVEDTTLAKDPVEVVAVHAELIRGESIGTGTGEPGQLARLKRPPIIRNADIDWALAIGVELGPDEVERSLEIATDRGKSFLIWREAASFSDLTPEDRVFVADRTEGRITFGPGPVGSMPAAGREIRAWYRRGGGRAGNVAPRSLTALARAMPGVSVTNHERAVGGEDAETPAELIARGKEAVRVLRTAVTARDFERVALSVGGIARARAGALRELWSFARPGVVDIQVVPQVAREQLPEGAVTSDVLAEHQHGELLARVESIMTLRRPIGVETQVSFTHCRPVSVEARVVVSRAENPERVGERLRRRLNDLLAPQGTWPHGKMLRASDVYEVLLSEPGVRYAEGVRLTIDKAPTEGVKLVLRNPHMQRSLFAATSNGLFRSEELGRGWEALDLGDANAMVTLAVHPEVPGVVAAVAEMEPGLQRLVVSEDVGENWQTVEQLQNEPIYDCAWIASRIGRPVLFIATRRALRRLELGAGAGSNNLQEITADGQSSGNGFFAVATARHPMDVPFVAIAARELGGILISRQGGAPRSFELVPNSTGRDVRSLRFQIVGDRMFLWAGLAAAAGAAGEGLMRIEARADGIDPAGWVSFGNGWRGGSCEDFDILGNTVVAGSNRAGVLSLDLAAPQPEWTVSLLDSGLPINNVRNALLPITSVAIAPAENSATIVAGAAEGIFVARGGERFERQGLTTHNDTVPLPRTWLYCSGEHRLDVVTDAEAAEA